MPSLSTTCASLTVLNCALYPSDRPTRIDGSRQRYFAVELALWPDLTTNAIAADTDDCSVIGAQLSHWLSHSLHLIVAGCLIQLPSKSGNRTYTWLTGTCERWFKLAVALYLIDISACRAGVESAQCTLHEMGLDRSTEARSTTLLVLNKSTPLRHPSYPLSVMRLISRHRRQLEKQLSRRLLNQCRQEVRTLHVPHIRQLPPDPMRCERRFEHLTLLVF